jgi:hypothetical protein
LLLAVGNGRGIVRRIYGIFHPATITAEREIGGCNMLIYCGT